MRDKRIIAVPILLVIALSMVGFAYATWSDQVEITGEAKMGSLTLGFSTYELPSCAEYYPNPSPPPVWLPGEWLGKEVGECTVYYTDEISDPHTTKVGYETLIAKITNAYPSYAVHVTFIIENLGSVPIHINEVTVTGRDETEGKDLVWVPDSLDPEKGELRDQEGNPIINVVIINCLCKQLDYCENTKAEMDIHFKQKAKECHTYTFKIKYTGVQWNKA